MSICVPNIQSASILLSNFIQFLLNRVTLQQTLFHFFMVRCFFVSFFFWTTIYISDRNLIKIRFIFVYTFDQNRIIRNLGCCSFCLPLRNQLFVGGNRKQVDTIEDNHTDIFKRHFKHTTRESIFFRSLSLSLPHQMPFQFHADFYQKLNRKDTFKYSQRNLKVAYLHKTELATSQKIGQDNK